MTASTDALTASIVSLTGAVLALCGDPADQIRLLISLAGTAAPPTSPDPVTAAMIRRAILGVLMTAVGNYLPSSYDDAVAVRTACTAVYDAEITYAGDMEDDVSYAMLRAMRIYVVLTLTSIGAQLPHLVTVTRPASLPALVLAYQLYGDASRADQLTGQVDPPHPAWFPTSFEALSF